MNKLDTDAGSGHTSTEDYLMGTTVGDILTAVEVKL